MPPPRCAPERWCAWMTVPPRSGRARRARTIVRWSWFRRVRRRPEGSRAPQSMTKQLPASPSGGATSARHPTCPSATARTIDRPSPLPPPLGEPPRRNRRKMSRALARGKPAPVIDDRQHARLLGGSPKPRPAARRDAPRYRAVADGVREERLVAHDGDVLLGGDRERHIRVRLLSTTSRRSPGARRSADARGPGRRRHPGERGGASRRRWRALPRRRRDGVEVRARARVASPARGRRVPGRSPRASSARALRPRRTRAHLRRPERIADEAQQQDAAECGHEQPQAGGECPSRWREALASERSSGRRSSDETATARSWSRCSRLTMPSAETSRSPMRVGRLPSPTPDGRAAFRNAASQARRHRANVLEHRGTSMSAAPGRACTALNPVRSSAR